MLAEPLFRVMELFFNRGLAQSTSAQALARDLEGRTLGLAVEDSPLDMVLRISGGRFVVGPADGTAPDASIRGSLLSLGQMVRRDARSGVRPGVVNFAGNLDVAERFRDLLGFATPDLEEELAKVVGDPLAREVGNAARAFAEWGQAAGRTIARSLSEYLQEESRLVVSRPELEEFARRVDALVNDVARAEARVARLMGPP